jgi:hypothetical protein
MNVGLVDKENVTISLFEKYRINTNWLQLIIKIAGEENKSRREMLLDKITKLKNFISILIAIWALIVSIIALVLK